MEPLLFYAQLAERKLSHTRPARAQRVRKSELFVPYKG